MPLRPWPKVDGKIDSHDFGVIAHAPFVHEPDDIAVFIGQDGNIDYEKEPIAYMSHEDTQVSIEGLYLPPNTIWHVTRCGLSECGILSEPSPSCIIMIDENGDMVGMTPNSPSDLTAELLAGGKIRLHWRYSNYQQQIAPSSFRIYIDSGSGFDFDNPNDEISYSYRSEFSWTSDILIHGQRYKFCVRSYRTDGGESQNTDFVSAIADAVGPPAITDLQISWEEI